MALVKDISSNIIACANSVGLKGKACASSVTLGSYTNHKLHLITNSSIRGTFDTSGNFGIGTDSPGARLDVRGSVIFNEAGGDNDVRMEGDTEANLFFLDASTDRVGIGTATPGALFHVEGASCVTSDVVVGGDLTVAGDDILMGTSTAGYMLVANGTSFKPTAISGDVNIDQTGATTIQAGSVENSMLANSSVSYGGVSVSLGSSDATPAFDLADATNYPTSSLVGTITNAQLAGSIANAKLSNSSVNFGGITVALGASDTTPAFDLSDATDYPTSSLVGTITNAQLAGSIANDKLANSSISYGGVSVSLGGSDGTPAFDLSDATAYPGDTSLVCVGTIAGGTWQGTAIDTDYIGSILCNKTLCAPVLNGTISGTSFLDEDDFSSDSATSVASQQSIKAYVDAVASGLDLKCSSHVATTANLSASYNNGTAGVGATLTNSGTQEALSIDGETLASSERVLVKDQTAACHNGIYTVTTVGNGSTNWVMTRATDYDTSTEITSGSFTFVETGTTNGDHAFVMTTDGTITVGTTAINWTQFSGAGQITAGAGLTKSGSTINVGAGSNITVNADDVALSTTITGLTALTATTLTGTLATAAQANITSVGTLTSLCSSGDVTVGGDLTIAGDDLTMGTNTSGHLLIADGTNYNPVAMSGDVTIDGSGATTIGATTVTNAMLAGSIANSKLSNSTVSYGGVSLSLGGSDATPAFDLADATNYPTSSLVGTITNAQLAGSIANSKLSNSTITLSDGSNTTDISLGGTMTFAGTSNEIEVAESSGTLTIGLPATVSGLTLVSATCLTGTLQTAAQTNVTSLGTLTALTVDNVTIDGATIGHTSDTDLITLADGSVTIAGDLTISGDDLTMGTNTSGYILVADGTNYNPVAVSGDVAIDNAGAVTIQALAVENSMLAGSIANAKLSNSSVSYGGISLSLGGSDATPAFDLADATNYPTSSLVGTITNAQLAGSIANDKLSNSTITLSDGSNTTAIALGGTMTFSGTSNEVEVSESSGTLTIGLPSTVSGLTTVSATNLTGTLSTAAQANVTSVGTLTSLTVSGDVTIDTTTLAVNSTTNRVGIGTATPSHLLDVEGVVNVVTCVITPVYCVDGEYALPASDGTTGQVLCTDGSGGLSFATNIPASPGGSDTYVQFNEGGSTFGGSANFTWDDTTVKASNFCTAGTATLATVDINAGAIDGTTIGATSASTIAGTTLCASVYLTGPLVTTTTVCASDHVCAAGNVQAGCCVAALKFCISDEYLFPTSDGSAGQIICTDGSGALAFATDSTNSPGGSDTNVQFNDSGGFGGSNSFVWNGTCVAVCSGVASVSFIAPLHVSTTCLTGTLQTAAQANVTSLGTLSALTVSGDVTIDTTTLKVDSTNNRVGIGTASPSHLLDVEGVAHFATCIVTPVVCTTGDAVVGGDLTIGGDDITMGTNTSGYILVADGTNYNPVAVSGDVTISDAGAVTIAADAVENSMLANCTVSYGGVSLALGGSDATPAFDLADATNYPTSSLVGTITNAQLAGSIANDKLANSTITISDGSNTTAISLGGTATFSGTSNEVEVAESSGTVTIGLPSTVSGLTTVSATTLTGTLSTAAQGNVTSLGNLTSLCVAGDTVIGGDLTIAGDDLTMGTNTDGYILVADGTNYNPVAVSGDVTISNAGAVTIAAGAVENSMLANCTVSYGGVQLVLGGTDATPAFDLADATNYPTSSLVGTITNAQLAGSIANSKLANSTITISDGSNTTAISLGGTATFSGTSNEVEVAESSGTVTIGLPSTVCGLTTVSATNLTGTLSTAAQGNVTSLGNLTSLCVSGDTVVGGDLTIAGDDLTMGTNTSGYILVADGTNYNPVAVSGDVTISSAGAITIAAGAVENSMLANCTVSYGGIQLVLGGTDATPAFDLTDATNYPTSSLVGTITNAQLAGSIANDKLSNSSVSFGGVSVALGAADATPAFDLSDATSYPTSSLVGTITNAQLAGSIANSKLANDSVSFGGVSVDLGASDATPAFDLSDATAYTGDSSLVTVGTISSGTWQGTAIATGYIAGTLTSKTLCDPVLVGTISGNAFLDEDDMASDSASKVASQQSIKAYVDSVASGLDMKCSSHVATTANLTADYNNGTSGVGATLTATSAGALSIDGETLASSERVLVKNQTAACHNGIYSVTNTGGHAACWILTRTTDFDSSTEVTSGAFTFVETGSTNGDHGFVMTSDGSITIGTTAINWTQFSGAGQITAGAGMTKSGNTLNVIAGDNITVNADDVALSTTITGVTSISSTCFTGTLQTAAQTNITSVGTLTSLCSSGDVTIGGDLTIAGDDLTMGTNTSGYLLIADGTNYNPVAMSGDVAITSSGATTIQASSVENSMLAGSIANSKLSNSTVSYGGVSLSLGGSDSTPAFDLADATNYPTSSLVGTITNAQLAGSIANSKLVNSTITLADGSSNSTDISLGGTMCFKGTSNEVEVAESSGIITIGLPSTVSGLTTVSATTLTGTLSTAVQSNITSLGSLSSLCVTGPVCMGSTLNTGSTITATTLCSSGDLVVAGDDITMGTNTSGYILVADGTNYNPVAVSGDVTISDAGAVTIAADAVENSMLANCTITVSDGSNTTAIALGGTATFSGTTNEVEVSESSGTLTIGLPSTVSGLTTVSATNLTGTLSTAAQGNITSVGTLSSLTISGALTVDTTTLKVDNHNNRVGIGTATPSHLLDIEGVGHAATCFVSADLCATTKVVGAALCVGGAYALPASDGSAGQILCTDGSGAIAFAAAASSGHTIAEDGSTFTSRTCLNFCGTAVSVTDCSATNSTDVQIRATGACMPIRLSAGTQCYTCLTSSVIGDCLQEDTSPTLGGNLDVNGNSIVSASNGNIPITPNGSGKVIVDGICHPTADGSAGQVLCTDGSAALQWATLSAGVTLNGSTDNTIATVTGSNALQGESNLTFDGSTLAVTGALTVGVDDTGHDVQFFGASAGHYMLWDQSADEMILRIGTTSTYAANTETGNLKLVNAGSDTDKQSVGIAFDVGAGNVGAIGKARIDAVHNGTGANSDLVFATQVSGTVTERIRILSGGGITFNGDTAAANALDDYEEGTWTACICAGSGSISLCTAYNTGSYTKIGRLVTLTGAFTVSSVSSPGGAALIYGMPFSTGGGSDQYEYRSAGSISPWAQTGTINSWAIFVPANSNTIYIQDNGVNAEADHFQAGTEIRMSMSYIV